MLESIGGVLKERGVKEKAPTSSSDAKIAIERWLMDYIKTDAVYCVDVGGSAATVRVGSPLIHQEVRLLETDLIREMQDTMGYTIKTITIVTSY